MGMFDEIKCHYPLPGTQPQDPTVLERMQTKDLDCLLLEFTINHGGALIDFRGERVNWSGSLYFYGTNFAACNPGPNAETIFYTPDGQDYEWSAYESIFENGQLMCIEQTDYERLPARPMREFSRYWR